MKYLLTWTVFIFKYFYHKHLLFYVLISSLEPMFFFVSASMKPIPAFLNSIIFQVLTLVWVFHDFERFDTQKEKKAFDNIGHL